MQSVPTPEMVTPPPPKPRPGVLEVQRSPWPGKAPDSGLRRSMPRLLAGASAAGSPSAGNASGDSGMATKASRPAVDVPTPRTDTEGSSAGRAAAGAPACPDAPAVRTRRSTGREHAGRPDPDHLDEPPRCGFDLRTRVVEAPGRGAALGNRQGDPREQRAVEQRGNSQRDGHASASPGSAPPGATRSSVCRRRHPSH